MKKTVSLLLCLCILFSLSGCAGTELFAKIKDFDIMAYLGDSTDWDSVQVVEPAAGSRYKYYFNQLGNKEKQAYSNILGEIETMPADIEIPSLTQEELSTVFGALLYDNPYLFFLGRSCTITTRGTKSYFNADYIMTAADYSGKKQALEKKADEIAAAFGSKNQWNTELYIHDYVIDNCSYSNTGTEDESSAYGALVGKAAACEGYAKAMKLLMDLAQADCFVLGGMAKNFQGGYESHMWNVVNIDGEYYHLDATWDDPVTIGKSEGNDPIYTYFNITDSEIKTTHKDFNSVHACTASAGNYFVKIGLLFPDYSQAVKLKIAKAIAAAADAGRTAVEIKFSGAEAYAKAVDGLFTDGQIYDILTEAGRIAKTRIPNTTASYITKDDFNIIEIVFK